jgi:hypothetical protein
VDRPDAARTLVLAAALADAMADLIVEAEELAGQQPALASRLLAARLRAGRPEDRPLVALMRWVAAAGDVAGARAALAARGWPTPASRTGPGTSRTP